MNQQKAFNARLARIAAQTGHTNSALFIGLDHSMPGAAAVIGRLQEKASGRRTLAIVQVVSAILSGALAWLWAHWVIFRLTADLSPGLQLAAGLLIGLTALGLVRVIPGLSGWRSFALQLTSMMLTAALLHNLVQYWPEGFLLVFAPEWVSAMMGIPQPAVLPGATLLL
ncbi:hypothetical protein [Falsigemmobacter faecalis]|uniref:Uncharacterized protein n=1 Tax=Falsigemmobacter faecalis TaxID=2488730 RepID=A0A3P3DGX0_9RHOB|nr:hypothetical protein [Falsigemmobacter faecalis]RRH73517.1 hypothetical protein EG244_12615 [Falsigemmobacter faecalis]